MFSTIDFVFGAALGFGIGLIAASLLMAARQRRRAVRFAYCASPWQGFDTVRRVEIARSLAIRAVSAGYFPLVPHLYLPQVLDDSNPWQRSEALKLCCMAVTQCDIVFAQRVRGWESEGLELELGAASEAGIPVEMFKELGGGSWCVPGLRRPEPAPDEATDG